MECHFVAQVTLLPQETSPRNNALRTGYRSMLRLRADMTNDALMTLVDQEWVHLGETARAKFALLAPEFQSRRLFPGMEFDVLEGNRLVAKGVIEQVIDPELEKPCDPRA